MDIKRSILKSHNDHFVVRIIYSRTRSTHQYQLENSKYRNWVKAGLGLKYTKDGMECFCDDLVKQQHIDILNKVKQKIGMAAANCGTCVLSTLKPDHVRDKNKHCPLGQFNCNCMQPAGKMSCPNNVCGAIYDEIVMLHASTPPAPCWRNTDVQKWCTDPWAIAKCFIKSPGHVQKSTASDMDIAALLHLLLNNISFQNHLRCRITGQDVISQVRKYRNEIVHSESLELDEAMVKTYIDTMKALLQDEKELKHRRESQVAVENLEKLEQEDFIITTKSEHTVIQDVLQEFRETVKNMTFEMDTTRAQVRSEAEENIKAFDERLNVLIDLSDKISERRMPNRNDEVITVTADDTSTNTQNIVDNSSVTTTEVRVDGATRSFNMHIHGNVGAIYNIGKQ